MKYRNTLLAVVLLAGLGSFIYFYEYKGEEGREKAAKDQKSLLVFDRDKTTSLEIARQGQPAVSLIKDAGSWKIAAPVPTRADEDKVSSLLTTLGFLQVDEEIPDVTGADLEGFGLGDSAPQITLKEGEAAPRTVTFGTKTAVGSNYYARRAGDAPVLVVSGGADQMLSADLASLRYKKVVGVDSFKLKRFQIDRGAARLAVAHEESIWRLEAPQPFPADTGKVQGLWFDVQSWEAEAYPVENPAPADLAAHGLDQPLLTLTVEAQDLPAPLRVSFGKAGTAPDVFARRSDMPAIMKVKSDTFDKIVKSLDAPDDLRDARVAPVDRWKIDSIEATPAGAPAVVLVKDEDSKWHWAAKDGPEMPAEEMNGLLDEIDSLKATSFLDRPGAADQRDAALTMTLREPGTATPVSWTFRIGVLGKTDGDARRVVSSAGSPIYLVPNGGAVTLIEKCQALRKPEPQATAPDDPNNPMTRER